MWKSAWCRWAPSHWRVIADLALLSLLVGLANAVVAFYIFMLVPEYLLRFVAWVLSRFVYRYRCGR